MVARFEDKRTPHEIRVHLEGVLRSLFRVDSENPLVMSAPVREIGSPSRLVLTFEAALPGTNVYGLRLDIGSEAAVRSGSSARGWFDFWIRGLQLHSEEPVPPGDPERYAGLVRDLVTAEAHLTTPAAVKREIVIRMKAGGTFSTAHKEGGTILSYGMGRFRSSDYGESSDSRSFPDEEAFLGYLREFYDWEARLSRQPEHVPELDVWRVILRLMSPPKSGWRSWLGL